MARKKEDIIREMEANSNAWWSADDATRKDLHQKNVVLADELDSLTRGKSTYDGSTGQWTLSEGTTSGRNDRGYVQYTGGTSQPGKSGFTYESAPAYVDKYADQIKTLTDALLNRQEFSYDAAGDPMFQSYKKAYTREGQRNASDVLGQYAAMTGGVPSTAALVASQQAGDYYNAQIADKIPELASIAYDRYRAEGADQLQNINLLMAMQEGDYNQYLNLLNQYNTDRNFAYGQYLDELNYDYQRERDAIADNRYAEQWQYQLDRDAIADSRYDTEWQYGVDRDAAADNRYNTEWQYQLDRDAIADSRYNAEWQYQQQQDALERQWQAAELAAQLGDYTQLAELAGVDPQRARAYMAAINGTNPAVSEDYEPYTPTQKSNYDTIYSGLINTYQRTGEEPLNYIRRMEQTQGGNLYRDLVGDALYDRLVGSFSGGSDDWTSAEGYNIRNNTYYKNAAQMLANGKSDEDVYYYLRNANISEETKAAIAETLDLRKEEDDEE